MIRIYSKRGLMNLFCIFALIFGTVATSAKGDQSCLSIPKPGKKYVYYSGSVRPITIDVSNRVSHQLITHVFKIYLQEVVGYQNITLQEHQDYFNLTDVMHRLINEKESSDPPNTLLNLEVWVPSEFDTNNEYAKHFIKECGSVTSPGRFGWFVPVEFITPVKEYYGNKWNKSYREVHYSIFQHEDVEHFEVGDSDLRHLIDMALDDPGGCRDTFCENSMYVPRQCTSQTCALLLTSDYNTTSFVRSDIDELGLRVKVIWLGSRLRDATDYLSNKYRKLRNSSKSLVMLHWAPSDIIKDERKYVSVNFHYCELFRSQVKSRCKYEMHRLVKFAWSKVETIAEPLHDALKVFKLDNYTSLLTAYEQSSSKVVSEVACNWLRSNPTLWNVTWKFPNRQDHISIGGIFPLNGSSYQGRGIFKAAHMATLAVNRNSSILSGYTLDLLGNNGECKAESVMKHFIDTVVDSFNNRKVVGVLGPACSDTVEPLAGVSRHYHMLVISYSAEGASFSNRDKYPYFFRTIGENQHYNHVYLKLMQTFNWKRVAALTEDGQKYTEYLSSMGDLLEKENITFITNKKFPRERENDGMTRYLQDLKSKSAKIIIADVVESVARSVMCEALNLQMTAEDGYVWFLPKWLDKEWYDTDSFNHRNNETVNCTTDQMIRSAKGYLSMTHAYFAPDDSVMQENKTVKEWRRDYYNFLKSNKNGTKSLTIQPSDYAGFAYDAVWTYALALDKLVNTNPEALLDLHSERTTRMLVKEIERTDFHGVSGRIKFRGGPSRFSIIEIYQWRGVNQSIHVANFHPNLTDDRPEVLGGNLTFLKEIQWFTKDGNAPDDGTQPPPVCIVDSVARFFNVECTHALIILNVIIAVIGIVFIILVIKCIKNNYEEKIAVKNTYIEKLENDNKKFGFPFSDLEIWEIARENVVINRKIGEGAFGTVYGGEADLGAKGGWKPVAVKTLKPNATCEEKLEFLSEADLMKRFDHPNIIKLVGVCTQKDPVYNIMEFMLYGDLKTFLLSRRHLAHTENDEVSPKRLTDMALDVARGLSYLAELKYTHRDLASRNCLVNGKLVVKIGDFGMTRQVECSESYYRFNRKGMLPVRWMAPESVMTGRFYLASDVWSYGVLLYEMITFGGFPYQGMDNNRVLDYIRNGGTPKYPVKVNDDLKKLMEDCWKKDSDDRIRASQIVEYLATRPTLLVPCLEDPPQMDLSNQMNQEIDMSDMPEFKRTSTNRVSQNGVARIPPIRPTAVRQQSIGGVTDSGISIPMDISCPKEPLLGPSRSTSSLLNLGKYVTIHSRREDSGCQAEEDDYIATTSNGHVITKV